MKQAQQNFKNVHSFQFLEVEYVAILSTLAYINIKK